MKSTKEIPISEYNQFVYNFAKTESKKNKKRKKDTRIKKDQLYYIKDSNMNIPSNDNLNDENFRKDFYNNYNNSFAKFCGINKEMYIEMYERIRYFPKLNQMGDVEVNINNIIKNLKKYSSHKFVKFHRSIKIKNNIFENNKRINKKLKTEKIGKLKEDSNEIENEENNLITKKDINIEIKDLKSNKSDNDKSKSNAMISINLEKEKKFIIIKPQNKSLLNIKRNLKKISIKKQNINIKINPILTEESHNIIKQNKENDNNKLNDTINDLSVKTNLYSDMYRQKDLFSLINEKQYNILISPENYLTTRINKNQNNIFNFGPDNDIDYFMNASSINNDNDNYHIKFSPNINLFNYNPVYSQNNLFVEN